MDLKLRGCYMDLFGISLVVIITIFQIFLVLGSNGPQLFTIEQWGTPDKLPRAHTWYVITHTRTHCRQRNATLGMLTCW